MAEDALRIKLADADAQHLHADKLTLQCYSACARGLPAAAEEWDLLLTEGQPVQRGTAADRGPACAARHSRVLRQRHIQAPQQRACV